VGISYKSAITHKLNGQVVTGLLGRWPRAMARSATQARFTTPWQVTWRPLEDEPGLTLNAQATRFGWAKFDSIKLGSPLNTAIPEDYRNTWAVAVGFDAQVAPKWTVRGGMQRDVSPVRPDERDARVPDSNRWNFALGATHLLSKAFKIDVAANYITLDDAPINRVTAAYAGTAAQTPVLVDGTLSKAHVVVLSLGGRLAF
jgi:long-chain fatty acid transport protein